MSAAWKFLRRSGPTDAPAGAVVSTFLVDEFGRSAAWSWECAEAGAFRLADDPATLYRVRPGGLCGIWVVESRSGR